ncbi:unnamed protein product [Ambrosiozyma monospora]|uniref:Unnamed protein product n=1 Tax=Ambrosiozyma monospora TaxID=43982 RepID=A0A9W6YXN1_AMBMO|nr:unnamed protein product [Ambrosiozyma monospora]
MNRYNYKLKKQQQQQQQQQSEQHNYWSLTPSLDTNQQQTVSRDITLAEIKKALKQQLASNPDSSPGKDGISYRFLDRAFSSFGPLLVEVYNNLFHAVELPETMKPVLFKFLLKDGKDKNEVTSYRPIALMSTITRFHPRKKFPLQHPTITTAGGQDEPGSTQLP